MESKETDEFTFEHTIIESEGTSLKSALDIARKFGNVTDDVLPFGPGSLFTGETGEFFSLASRLKIRNYHRLDKISEWKEWLANNGPVLIILDGDKTWDALWDNPKRNSKLDKYSPLKILAVMLLH